MESVADRDVGQLDEVHARTGASAASGKRRLAAISGQLTGDRWLDGFCWWLFVSAIIGI
jgi:hypothetical protein